MKRDAIRKSTHFALSLILVGVGLTARADAERFQPAQFGDALTHLQQAVVVPELSTDLPVVGVYCQADVATTGMTSTVSCYEKEGFDTLREQTEQAMTDREFVPATVDDVAVPVRMHFRVVYSNRAGQDPILLLPNLGNMQKRFGLAYVAPQERLDSPQWYTRYRADSAGEGRTFFSSEGPLTRVLVQVGEDGEVKGTRRIEAHGRHKRDAVVMEKALKESKFVPGMADGKTQTMQYVAVLNYAD